MRTSLDYVNAAWSDTTLARTPAFGASFFAMLDDQNVVLAPPPDLTYPVRVTGTWRPDTLSGTNQTSYLGTVYPDLVLFAAMVEVSAYQGNFSAAGDIPQQSISWTTRYHEALTAARAEERRRKGLPPEPP